MNDVQLGYKEDMNKYAQQILNYDKMFKKD